MQQFLKHFQRYPNGCWECVQHADFNGPNGRIEVTAGSRFMPGTKFMGVDLAEWLEQCYREDQRG